ncbi:hypothetical protein BDA99DRAFT_577591 [Phascolomyces articulosus]|uniref:Uncharacterized protein n=1 Tax=Phascolomyces articulosus TaxID=60185 RepID=A0AAD5JL13_9FUNG|nr:hypothetical protein BDA99DRAFT_577591 [Phascolomyces articulosus]
MYENDRQELLTSSDGPTITTLNEVPLYYLRCAHFNNKHDNQQQVGLYTHEYAADIAWSTYVIDSTNPIHDQEFTLLYAGMTLGTTPEQRLHSDSKVLGTRFTNLNKVTSIEWSVYQITGLNLQPGMSVVNSGYIEDIWIKAIGNVAQNLANQYDYPNGYNSVSATPQMQDHINTHFTDYSEFIRSSKNAQLRMPHPTNALTEAVRNTGTPHLFMGEVVSILIGKDITRNAFNAGVGFWQDTGTSPYFLREMYELQFTLAGGTANMVESIVHPTFIDVYSLSYMQLPAWRTPASRFLDMHDRPRSFTYFNNVIDPFINSTTLLSRYNEYLGDISIVSYGPGPLDLALFVPMRHPGSLRYDPIIQQLKA